MMMRETRILAIAMLATLVVSVALLTPSTATADYTKVGVKVGDTATYSVSEPNSTVNRAIIRFVNVDGTLVNMTVTLYNPNGSVNSTLVSGMWDVSTGAYSEYLICANLSANDPIWNYAGANVTVTGAPKINETVRMAVAGTTRTVNYVNQTSVMSGNAIEHPDIHSCGVVSQIIWSVNIWWDQPTGLMVKWTEVFSYTVKNVTHSAEWIFTLTSTPLFWSSGSSVILICGAVVVIVVIVAVAAYAIDRRGKSK